MGTKIDVRYAETDKMGIVHHSNYSVWFEVARVEFFKKIGLDYKELEHEGLLHPVIELNVGFKKPARFGDEVTVITKIEYFNGLRMIFNYEVINNTDESVISYGSTQHVWVNCDFNPVNLKKHRTDIYETIMKIYKREENQ